MTLSTETDYTATWSGKPASASITEWGVDKLWHDTHTGLTEQDEHAAIAAHRAGDPTAARVLMAAYMPAIKRIVSRHSATAIDHDDIRQTAALGFMEALAAFDADKHARLAVLVQHSVERVLSEHLGQAFTARVPQRTRERYARIMRVANGDATLGEELAPEHGMSPRVFREVHQALQPVQVTGSASQQGFSDGPYDPHSLGARQPWDTNPGEVSADDAETVDRAMSTDLDDRERIAITMAYPLDGSEPATDGQIAQRLGVHRTTALRVRESALAKVRLNVGAAA